MKKTVFYKLVDGNYEPVYEYDQELMDAFPKGTHIVMCYPGGNSRRYSIDPAYGPMIAAGRVAEDAISRHIMEVSSLRPSSIKKPLTEEQREAWERLSGLMGDERYALEWCSYREAAEEGVKAMMQEAEKLLEHPSVRKAWERFLLVCELTKERKPDA